MTLSGGYKAKKKKRHFQGCNAVRLLDTVRGKHFITHAKAYRFKKCQKQVNLTLFPGRCDVIRNRLLIQKFHTSLAAWIKRGRGPDAAHGP